LTGRHSDALGVSAATEQCARRVADLPVFDTVADRGDRTRAFEAEYVGCAGRRGVVAHALQQVGAVHPCRGDVDDDLAGAEFWVVAVDHLQGVDTAWLRGYHGTHEHTVRGHGGVVGYVVYGSRHEAV